MTEEQHIIYNDSISKKFCVTFYHIFSHLDGEQKIGSVDDIVTYLPQISEEKKVSGFDVGDFSRLKRILELEQEKIKKDIVIFTREYGQCKQYLLEGVYKDYKLKINAKSKECESVIEDLNRSIKEQTNLIKECEIEMKNNWTAIDKIEEEIKILGENETNSEKLKEKLIERDKLPGMIKPERIKRLKQQLKQNKNTVQQRKIEKEKYKEYLKELEQREKKLMNCTECSDYLCEESFFESKISDELKNNGVTQVGNVIFPGTEKEEVKEDILKLIEYNKDKKRPTFYIVPEKAHWYVIAQQGEQIFNLNVSSMRGNIGLLSIKLELDKELTYFKYNTGTQKLQYSSGCCEMYCVLLPYLLTRCMLFNGITELKDLFIINKNNFTFQSFLYNGLCEKAFSADIVDKYYTEDKGFKDGRIELLEGQVKGSTEDSSMHLLYNGHTTFQEIFSQYLNSEINYIQYMQQDYKTENGKTKATNMKGGFIYRYAIMMSNMSDPEYRKHLKEYFEKCLDSYICDEYVTTETEKQFFKENFQFLLSRFNKLFLGNAVCNYSVVSTSHEYQYRVNDKAYFQHLLNDYARLQGIPIEEDIHFNLEQENLIAPTPIDLTAIKKLNNSDNIVFGSNDDIGQLIPHFMERINNDGYINLIYNDKQADTKAHYVAAQIFKDTDGIITLLYTDPLDREIDNRFKSFVEKTLGKKIEDVKIINVDNQLFEQCSNNVNMNSLLALTAIRDGGILDMQRESILNEQNQSSEQSWVGRLCESQQKTHSRENSF